MLSNHHKLARGLLAGAFNPAMLFAAGEQGAWYDYSDLTTMFQDSAGTIPAVVGQPVGLVLDKSGRGNHKSQATSASRPVLHARINGLTKTNQLDDAAWTKSNATVTPNAAIAYDDTISMDKLVENTALAVHYAEQAPALLNSTQYVVSGYVKAAERTRLYIWLADTGWSTVNAGAVFNVSDGTIVSQNGTVAAKIVLVKDGIYRWSIGDTTAASGTRRVRVALNNGSATYTGDGVSGIYVSHIQIDQGSVVGRYQDVVTATDYDSVGFPHYLLYDGFDDGFVTASVDFSASDEMTVVAGVRKLSDAAVGTVVELSATADSGGNPGAFFLRAPGSVAGTNMTSYHYGATAGVGATAGGLTSPVTVVSTLRTDLGIPSIELRKNAIDAVPVTTATGGGNYGNYPLYFGRRNNVNVPYNGQCYGMLIRGALMSFEQTKAMEAYMNKKTGAY